MTLMTLKPALEWTFLKPIIFLDGTTAKKYPQAPFIRQKKLLSQLLDLNFIRPILGTQNYFHTTICNPKPATRCDITNFKFCINEKVRIVIFFVS